jgi:hypothetical protein
VSKDEKKMGIPAASTIRRIDPPPAPHKKAGRSRKAYPDHWQVRNWNGHYYHINPSHYRGSLKDFRGWGEWRRNLHTIQELLDYLAEKYPETAEWPVRWISGAVEPCNRGNVKN